MIQYLKELPLVWQWLFLRPQSHFSLVPVQALVCTNLPSEQNFVALQPPSSSSIIYDAFQLENGSAIIYNDCSKAVKFINAPSKKFKRFLANDYDLQNESRIFLCKLNKFLTVCLIWVKGHYRGDNKEIQNILNEDARRVATSFLHSEESTQQDILAPTINASLLLAYHLHSNWQSHVLEALLAPPLQRTI